MGKEIFFLSFIFLGGVCLGGTNEWSGTDHVTSGPMRGLEKKMHPMAQTYKQTDKQTDMALKKILRLKFEVAVFPAPAFLNSF